MSANTTLQDIGKSVARWFIYFHRSQKKILKWRCIKVVNSYALKIHYLRDFTLRNIVKIKFIRNTVRCLNNIYFASLSKHEVRTNEYLDQSWRLLKEYMNTNNKCIWYKTFLSSIILTWVFSEDEFCASLEVLISPQRESMPWNCFSSPFIN